MWVEVVYFDGEAEARATRDLLLQVADDVDDESFQSLRSRPSDGERQWPMDFPTPI